MSYTLYNKVGRGMFIRCIVFACCIIIPACATDVVSIPEIIQTPVDLQIVAVTGGHEISFMSDNRENGFSGYGIFIGATQAEAGAEPAPALSTHFCAMASREVPYSERIKVMAGAAAPAGYICGLSALVLTSGQFVAVRARVERDDSPWSKPVIAQVP